MAAETLTHRAATLEDVQGRLPGRCVLCISNLGNPELLIAVDDLVIFPDGCTAHRECVENPEHTAKLDYHNENGSGMTHLDWLRDAERKRRNL